MTKRPQTVLLSICVCAAFLTPIDARPAGSGPQTPASGPSSEASAESPLVGTWVLTAMAIAGGQAIPEIAVGQDWMAIKAATWMETIEAQLTKGRPVVRNGSYRLSGDRFIQQQTVAVSRAGSGGGLVDTVTWKFVVAGDTLVFTEADRSATTWRRVPTGMTMAAFIESLHQPFIQNGRVLTADPPAGK